MTAALDMQHPVVVAMLDDERRFDATRPPCPPWCDATCETLGHMGNAIIHCSVETSLWCTPASSEPNEGEGVVRVKASRYEQVDNAPELTIDLDVSDADGAMPGLATFTAQQARALIVSLTEAVERIAPTGGTR